MSVTLTTIAWAGITLSFFAGAFAARRRDALGRAQVAGALAAMSLGFFLLVTSVGARGWIGTTMQSLLAAATLFFLGMDWRFYSRHLALRRNAEN